MISFAHLAVFLGFIAVGALGMAAMQDGLTLVWRRFRRNRTAPATVRKPGCKPALR